MYQSIEDLPIVCQINLPEPALRVYRDAYNRAWKSARDHRTAQNAAWAEVRQRFERDKLSGRWIETNSPYRATREEAHGEGHPVH
jgi:cation transport regulator ChaB